ncbi:hypothetical protein [Aliiglaciecola sp. LCG003]|uniref:hypothetical protein n=1 Tax=Aliiglaciecola sp. LCG003 TaxID=3053655 RepID=UPI002573DBF9|nr:hypothetical protein [Aliiglaciecola sp. LCG003]WJG10055.1 hypothetical protein QR722_03170 [Aliiglaciecola sp. LCG003]
MNDSLTCWKCGAGLGNVILPMSRREECPQCAADQHVCKMCEEYDGKGGCNEPRAEQVSDTEKANFCDYFSPSGKHFNVVTNQKALDAKAQLAALFGEELAPKLTDNAESLTPTELAEKKLREMLGG